MADIVPPQDETCATCARITGTKRYCALARCYCGHADCPAVESYIDLSTVAVLDAPVRTDTRRSSWDDREGATWIDSL